MSLIFSLGYSSEIHAPIIMDNPLSSLGTKEQDKVIKSFDEFSHQTLLFLTTSEYQQEQQDSFKNLKISKKVYNVSNLSKGFSEIKLNG